MRNLDVPEPVDILISELLGSFGDNELSPECLDGAQNCLKRTFYTSLLDHVLTYYHNAQRLAYRYLHPIHPILPLYPHRSFTMKHVR